MNTQRLFLATEYPYLSSGYDSYMPSAISQAQSAGKKLIIEEWGSLVGTGRTANVNSNVQFQLLFWSDPWRLMSWYTTGSEDQQLQGPLALLGAYHES